MAVSSGLVRLGRFVTWTWLGLIGMWILLQGFPGEVPALALLGLSSAIVIYLLRRFSEDKEFVTTLFLAALAVRMTFGIVIYIFPNLREFFGGDSMTYDILGGVIDLYR